MNGTKLVKNGLIMCLLGACLAGGAGPQAAGRYVWPRLPERPRIEWLATYQGERDLPNASFVGALVEEAPSLEAPMFVATDGEGKKIYISDQLNRGVLVFDVEKGKVHKLAATDEKRPLSPAGIALDEDGNIYVADTSKHDIYVYGQDEQLKKIIELGKQVNGIGALTIDVKLRRLIVPDIRGHRIAIFDYDGKFILALGKGRGVEDEQLNYPTAVAIDKEGNYLVCDQMNARIQRFTPDGKFLSRFGQRGDGGGELAVPKAVAVDSEGHVYVTDGKNHKVGIYDVSGQYLLDFGGPFTFQGTSHNPGGFNTPQGIVIDRHDRIYVVDSMNRRLQIFQYMNDSYLEKHPITEKDMAPDAAPPKKAR